jgi:hypothetical protein
MCVLLSAQFPPRCLDVFTSDAFVSRIATRSKLPDLEFTAPSRISVAPMVGAAIVIDDASADDTILSVKQRVHAANRELSVHRQLLVYRPGPRGMEALADDETLGGAGVAQDGSAEMDVLLAERTKVEVNPEVSSFFYEH